MFLLSECSARLTGQDKAARSFGPVLKRALICGRALSRISLSCYSSHNVAISAAALQTALQTAIGRGVEMTTSLICIFFSAVVLTGGLVINNSYDPLRGVSSVARPSAQRAT